MKERERGGRKGEGGERGMRARGVREGDEREKEREHRRDGKRERERTRERETLILY